MDDDTYIGDSDIAEYCTNCKDHGSKRTRSGKVLDYCKRYNDYCFRTLLLCKATEFHRKKHKQMVKEDCHNCEHITNKYKSADHRSDLYCMHYYDFAIVVIERCRKDHSHMRQTTLCGTIGRVR